MVILYAEKVAKVPAFNLFILMLTVICWFTVIGKIREDMCGFEEITKKPDPIEIRPWGPTYVNLTLPPPPADRHQETQIIVAGLLVFYSMLWLK